MAEDGYKRNINEYNEPCGGVCLRTLTHGEKTRRRQSM